MTNDTVIDLAEEPNGARVEGKYDPLQNPGVLELVFIPKAENLGAHPHLHCCHLQFRRRDVDRLINRLQRLRELFDLNPAGNPCQPLPPYVTPVAGPPSTSSRVQMVYDPGVGGEEEAAVEPNAVWRTRYALAIDPDEPDTDEQSGLLDEWDWIWAAQRVKGADVVLTGDELYATILASNEGRSGWEMPDRVMFARGVCELVNGGVLSVAADT